MWLRMDATTLCRDVEAELAREGDLQGRCELALRRVADHFGAVTATLHRASEDGNRLELVAALGLPEPVLAKTRQIPVGKGMAGICAERREPVTVCNLQTDASGVAKPGAKLTGVEGAIAWPVLQGSSLRGTLGVGKAAAHDYDDDERALLGRCADLFAAALRAGHVE